MRNRHAIFARDKADAMKAQQEVHAEHVRALEEVIKDLERDRELLFSAHMMAYTFFTEENMANSRQAFIEHCKQNAGGFVPEGCTKEDVIGAALDGLNE